MVTTNGVEVTGSLDVEPLGKRFATLVASSRSERSTEADVGFGAVTEGLQVTVTGSGSGIER